MAPLTGLMNQTPIGMNHYHLRMQVCPGLDSKNLNMRAEENPRCRPRLGSLGHRRHQLRPPWFSLRRNAPGVLPDLSTIRLPSHMALQLLFICFPKGTVDAEPAYCYFSIQEIILRIAGCSPTRYGSGINYRGGAVGGPDCGHGPVLFAHKLPLELQVFLEGEQGARSLHEKSSPKTNQSLLPGFHSTRPPRKADV